MQHQTDELGKRTRLDYPFTPLLPQIWMQSLLGGTGNTETGRNPRAAGSGGGEVAPGTLTFPALLHPDQNLPWKSSVAAAPQPAHGGRHTKTLPGAFQGPLRHPV